MPKGKGLGLGIEARYGKAFSRAKRWNIVHYLFTDFDWPHKTSSRLSRCWKRHRKTQWKY